jgi:outer membrane protein assembly factor BamB
MNHASRSLLATLLALSLPGCINPPTASSTNDASAVWSRFRGPNGTGLARGEYPAEIGPDVNVLWAREFHSGQSSPVLSKECVFLTGVEDERLFTYALDRDTGATLWKREAPRPRRTRLHPKNHAAAASAAVDKDSVVVFFDEYGLLAYDHEGQERWRLPLGPFDNVYGMGASPIIVGDVVVLACDQSTDSYVLGVSKQTGDVLWKVGRPQAVSGHCTPVVHHTPEGRAQVILPGSYLLDAYDAQTGERVWWVRGLPGEMKSVPVLLGETLWTHGFASPVNNQGNQIEYPPFAEALVLMDADKDGSISAPEIEEQRVQQLFVFFDLDGDEKLDEVEWEGTRASLASVNSAMAIRVGGKGDRTDDAVQWRYHRSIPQLPSPLVVEGVYYLLGDQGGLLTALAAGSGEPLERSRLKDAVDSYYAAPVAGGGHVYLLSESGILSVLSAGGSLDPIHTMEFGEPCYATPALEDGRIWLRSQTRLYCFGNLEGRAETEARSPSFNEGESR